MLRLRQKDRKEIKYVGFYHTSDSNPKRVGALAAINKMDYICEALNAAGYDIHLVSPSWLEDSSSTADFHFKSKVLLSDKVKLTLSPSFGAKNKFARFLQISFSLSWLFFWLVCYVKRREKILVYHSTWITFPVLLAKKIKGFDLVLEVEEVYKDVFSLHPYFDKLELRIFKAANSFVLSTELLANRINANRNYITVYGNYKVYEKIGFRQTDGKIHVLYAGIIDSHKAGAFNAIESARYLTCDYVIHILGFGEVERLKTRIEEINSTSDCKVFYEGIKTGEEFVKFCQSCHIGLSTQKSDGDYLSSSFPSKILTYLGMGLSVVSCAISSVEHSKIGDYIYYYNEDTPNAIANAIKNVNINKLIDYVEVINTLHLDFVKDLKMIFNEGQ